MKKIEECSQAIAEAVKLCKPGVIASYPITPQTHIVEALARFVNDGELNSQFIDVESEHSAMSACIGAQATGVRTFTATASQGLALMHEVLFIASGLRLPIVMAVANRALSAPINIWNDHSDSLASRDSGWLQLYCESSQEAHDTIFQAYKIAESVDLPVMVCIDGFTLSHVWENVDIIVDLKNYLPNYNPEFKLDPKKPVTMGPIAFPDTYQLFKEQQQDAMLKSINEIKKANLEFYKLFGRKYGDGLVEGYKLKGAKKVIVAMGSVCGTIKVVVDELRRKREKVGLLKIKTFRPFPKEEIKKELSKIKEIKVIDRDISFGSNGALYTEVKEALFSNKFKIENFITGLGGKDIRKDDIKKIFDSKNGGWI